MGRTLGSILVLGPTLGLALGATLLAACGPSQSPTTVTPYRAPTEPAEACPLLLQCYSAAINDRCPEPFFEFPAASAEIAPRTVELLEALAAEIQATPQLEQVRLQGFASPSESEELAGERAAAIRDWLIDEGVPDQQIDITSSVSDRDQASYVAIDAVECGGRASEQPTDRTPVGAISNVLF
ncbi:MAG TPA: OmpA family protein [Kofleriaceae bacterium]|nr:OmpA family protein [Kofleriaceae bacterium]